MKTLASSLLIALILCTTASSQQSKFENQIRPDTRNIVFVCEHGAALSVVAAAYFNKLAQEQHLNWHGVARGVTPQEDLSVSAAAGLKKDGVTTEVVKPQAVTQQDFNRADYVVTFLPLPGNLKLKTPLEEWYDVQWTPNDYDKARDGILKHIEGLLPKLKSRKAR